MGVGQIIVYNTRVKIVWPFGRQVLLVEGLKFSLILGRLLGWDDLQSVQLTTSFLNYRSLWSSFKNSQVWFSKGRGWERARGVGQCWEGHRAARAPGWAATQPAWGTRPALPPWRAALRRALAAESRQRGIVWESEPGALAVPLPSFPPRSLPVRCVCARERRQQTSLSQPRGPAGHANPRDRVDALPGSLRSAAGPAFTASPSPLRVSSAREEEKWQQRHFLLHFHPGGGEEEGEN